MEHLRQVSSGFLFAILSIIVVLGGFSLASIEGGRFVTVQLSTATLPVIALAPTSFSTIPVLTEPVQPTSSDLASGSPTVSVTSLPSITPPPTSASCAPPPGWVAVLVQSSDSVALLAQAYQTSPTSIKNGNCLISDQLMSGSVLYLPALPTATAVPCGAPGGWVPYTVINGDTLYNLGQRYRVTVADLQIANCLGTSTYLQAGKPIKVPFVPTSTTAPSATLVSVPSSTFTLPPTVTATQLVLVPTQTSTPTSTPTDVPTDTPTATLTAPATPTVTPTP
jgi:LysM repeat protein